MTELLFFKEKVSPLPVTVYVVEPEFAVAMVVLGGTTTVEVPIGLVVFQFILLGQLMPFKEIEQLEAEMVPEVVATLNDAEAVCPNNTSLEGPPGPQLPS